MILKIHILNTVDNEIGEFILERFKANFYFDKIDVLLDDNESAILV